MKEMSCRPADAIFYRKILLIDTGMVMSIRNGEITSSLLKGWAGLSELEMDVLQKEREASQKARQRLKDTLNTLIVPEEVLKEVANHEYFFRERIRTLEKVNAPYLNERKHMHQIERKKIECLRGYVEGLEAFREESKGRDPRKESWINNRSYRVDSKGQAYKLAWDHFSQKVGARHRIKNQPPSDADTALLALASLVYQRHRIIPCILTRDGDFEEIASEESQGATPLKTEYVFSHTISFTSGPFAITIYTPRE
ncbi:MAG: hypothetical protein AABY00_03960 [Nanoarchaeota archaeon]